jgi:adenylate cyclase
VWQKAGVDLQDFFRGAWTPQRLQSRGLLPGCLLVAPRRSAFAGTTELNHVPTKHSSDVKFEIGHVLFIDIVGYSKLLINEQSEQIQGLKQIVRGTEEVRKAEADGKLLRLPTGDGGALVFRNSPEAPVLCAMEISRELEKHPELRVRMGIHSGPVNEITDLNEHANIAGAGINIAQRVMDCGDAGHILLSKHVADDLEHYPRWKPYLRSLGECEVKHGVCVGIVNLYRDGIGNPQLPNKFKILEQRRARARWIAIAAASLFLAGIIAAFVVVSKKSATPTLNAPGKSIAVLPFLNMSADKNDEYLSDGMTEELINVLATVPGLRVPGRTSSFAFKGKNEENIFRKVGDQLHVGTVLEGSVRKAGDKLRVTAQLINVSDGYHLWSKDYDGDLKDILNFQTNVAKQVVQALQMKLGIDETRALAKKPTENPEAHRLYLLGRYHLDKFTEANVTAAVDYFNQALQLDPGFALAYCGLADAYGEKAGNAMPSREAWAKQKAFAQKALVLDADLAQAHLSLGIALGGSFDWAGAKNEFDRALELNPNLPYAYDASGWLLTIFGRSDQAVEKEKKALELDPLNPSWNDGLGWYLYWAGRNDEAMRQLRSSIELFPSDAFSHFALGWCLLKKGNAAEAKAELQKAIELDDLPWYMGWLGYTYAVSGDRAKAEEILRQLDELAQKRYVTPNARVPVYLGLGDKNKALDGLEKSYEEQDGVCWQLNIDQRYDGLRNEPRFQALLKKLGLDK